MGSIRTGLRFDILNRDNFTCRYCGRSPPDVKLHVDHIHPQARGGGNEAAGHVMALMLFLIFASIIGYMLAIVATAQARGYVAIRYFKDTYKIPDESPLFFEDEHVNPPVEGEEQETS